MSTTTDSNELALPANSNNLFNRHWQIYQKVFQCNYMKHNEIGSLVNQFICNYFDRPFNILDLGCGDASFSARALVHPQIYAYQGVDLSEPALNLARIQMENFPGEHKFVHSDFLELVKIEKNKFDLIFSSFALHHLSYEQKDTILGQIANLLRDDGVFILVDIVLKEQETRDSYLRRYIDDVINNWQLIEPGELELIAEHITQNDFPETQEKMQSLATKYHLKFESLYLSPKYTEQVLCFYPSIAMSESTTAWYIVKVSNHTCEIVTQATIDSSATTAFTAKWGPFDSQSEAIAKRVGLIRAGKCQPL